MTDGLREFIRERLDAIGRGPVEAATAAGLQKHFINDILHGRKQSVRGANLDKLAGALDVKPADLLNAMAGRPPGGGDVLPAPGVKLPAAPPLDVPVRDTSSGMPVVLSGEAGGAVEGFFMENDQSIGSVSRPPALTGVPDAYAIYVVGESMAPMHSAGELRFVHPHKPARPGDTVLIYLAQDGREQAFIKRLVARTVDEIVAEQLQPAAIIRFRAASVRAVHKVLTTNELFGA